MTRRCRVSYDNAVSAMAMLSATSQAVLLGVSGVMQAGSAPQLKGHLQVMEVCDAAISGCGTVAVGGVFKW